VSFDDGATWTGTPVARDGLRFCSICQPGGHTGGYVYVCADMTDSEGCQGGNKPLSEHPNQV